MHTDLEDGLDLDRGVAAADHTQINVHVSEVNDRLKRVRGGQMALGAVGVLTLLFVGIQATTGVVDVAAAVGIAVEALLFLGLAALVPRYPRLALTAGLALYLLEQTVTAVQDPSTLGQGLVFRGFVVGFLVLALVAEARIRRELAALRRLGLSEAQLAPVRRLREVTPPRSPPPGGPALAGSLRDAGKGGRRRTRF